MYQIWAVKLQTWAEMRTWNFMPKYWHSYMKYEQDICESFLCELIILCWIVVEWPLTSFIYKVLVPKRQIVLVPNMKGVIKPYINIIWWASMEIFTQNKHITLFKMCFISFVWINLTSKDFFFDNLTFQINSNVNQTSIYDNNYEN